MRWPASKRHGMSQQRLQVGDRAVQGARRCSNRSIGNPQLARSLSTLRRFIEHVERCCLALARLGPGSQHAFQQSGQLGRFRSPHDDGTPAANSALRSTDRLPGRVARVSRRIPAANCSADCREARAASSPRGRPRSSLTCPREFPTPGSTGAGTIRSGSDLFRRAREFQRPTGRCSKGQAKLGHSGRFVFRRGAGRRFNLLFPNVGERLGHDGNR